MTAMVMIMSRGTIATVIMMLGACSALTPMCCQPLSLILLANSIVRHPTSESAYSPPILDFILSREFRDCLYELCDIDIDKRPLFA